MLTESRQIRLFSSYRAARNSCQGLSHLPSPMDTGHPTPDETKAEDAWEVREASAFIEVSFPVADSAKHVLATHKVPRLPESRSRSGLVLSKKGYSRP